MYVLLTTHEAEIQNLLFLLVWCNYWCIFHSEESRWIYIWKLFLPESDANTSCFAFTSQYMWYNIKEQLQGLLSLCDGWHDLCVVESGNHEHQINPTWKLAEHEISVYVSSYTHTQTHRYIQTHKLKRAVSFFMHEQIWLTEFSNALGKLESFQSHLDAKKICTF